MSGTITFFYTTGNTCPTSGSVTTAGAIGVSGNGGHTSAPMSISTPGTYNMYAVYSGDSNNNAAASACEPLTVTPATGVPEFPVGIFALMGIMVPALLLLRKRSISGSPMAS